MSAILMKQTFIDKTNNSYLFKFKSTLFFLINRVSSQLYKVMVLLFAVFLLLTLIGCGSGSGRNSGNSSNTSAGGESGNSSNIDNRSIFAGFIDSFIVSNGKAYGAGRNANGQLSLGDITNRHSFTEVTVP
jgi:hypothetical protein